MSRAAASRDQPLSPKQQRFVSEYLKDQNATQAAIRAGYSKGTAKQQGSRLLTNADVAAAVNKGQRRVAKKAEVTADSLMAELEQARKLALKEKQSSAAVAATMGKAKIGGHIVERHRHSGAIGTYDLSKLSDDELDRLEAILGPLAHTGGDPGGEDEEGG
ncbi:terminase small subunit [Xanthomonas translucens]|nr:terminase small subunit [Xanthomonas translucens]MCT8281763.1 terminase small subunit [Xanthomonas translucens pv. undulosa]MCT8316483.1 terminase small subunit [Xanthomonas translucens pv. undulosa]UKE38278.1 terminase small subunit [Xanthomonas translucens pv. undulosa]